MTWLTVGYVFFLTFSLGVFADDKCDDPEISHEEVVKIVEAEVEKRFGNIPRAINREINIRRDGCDYIYAERDVPHRPGGYFVVKIDSKGRVLEFMPGV